MSISDSGALPEDVQPKVVFSVDPGFRELPEFGTAVQRCVMPLLTRVGDTFQHVGTGFMIHPDGLMMTATHVLRYAESLGSVSIDPITRERSVKYELYALYVSTEPNDDVPGTMMGGPFPVDFVFGDDSLDVALCLIRLPTHKETGRKIKVHCCKLKIDLPKVGDKISAIGYYGSPATPIEELGSGGEQVDYVQQTAITTGEITEIHPIRRDRGLLKWPCFETNALTEHGLSGGPIFHASGSVCGVVCSKTPAHDDEGKYCFYGSLVWPALGIRMELRSQDGNVEAVHFVDLIRRGLVNVEGNEKDVSMVQNDDGTYTLSLRQ